jgi:XTP/dITP diphosphohydrolase
MKICLATRNNHKIEEIKKQLPHIQWLSLEDIQCHEELPETHQTILENSAEKALFIWQNYQINCLADDSGLEVEALNNEPGVDSAHYSGERDSEKNIELLLKNLQEITNRKARFVTILSLVIEGNLYQFEGEVQGTILKEKRGTQGFGYDPIFLPNQGNKTFAEMNIEEKNKLSHRSNALNKLKTFLSL